MDRELKSNLFQHGFHPGEIACKGVGGETKDEKKGLLIVQEKFRPPFPCKVCGEQQCNQSPAVNPEEDIEGLPRLLCVIPVTGV